MKSKHLNNQLHTELFLFIQKEVDSKLNFCANRFRIKMLSKCITYFILTIITYISLYWVINPILFISVLVLYGFISLLFAFNFAHDFSHNTIFKSKKLNHRCFVLLYAIVGAHGEAWKERHVKSHHHAPNVEGYDTDLEITDLIRVVPQSPIKWFHQFQHLYALFLYTTYSLFWVFIKDFKVFYQDVIKSRSRAIRYKISFWSQKIFYVTYLVILPILFTDQKWYLILIGFLIMHVLQSLFLLCTFFMTHHIEGLVYPTTNAKGVIEVSWLMNQIQSSNDFYPFSKMANFVFGGFNNHIAHHLFPHIHHIYYPELNKILYQVLIDNHIKPNQTTYFGGLMSHLTHLKKMGKLS